MLSKVSINIEHIIFLSITWHVRFPGLRLDMHAVGAAYEVCLRTEGGCGIERLRQRWTLLGSALFSRSASQTMAPVFSQKETDISSRVYLWGQTRGRLRSQSKHELASTVNPLLSLSQCPVLSTPCLRDRMTNVFMMVHHCFCSARLILTNHRTHSGQ